MREPRYPLPRVVCDYKEAASHEHTANGGNMKTSLLEFSFPWHTLCRGLLMRRRRIHKRSKRTRVNARRQSVKRTKQALGPTDARLFLRVHGSFCFAGFDNDPSAGSPMKTLLRLLLPLNDKVQWNSRDVTGSEPPTSPRSEHFTGPFNR